MAVYEKITTNRLAFLESIGIDHSIVIEDGVTDEGVIVVGHHPNGKPLFPEQNAVLKSLIPYPDEETRARAYAACLADWHAETGRCICPTCGHEGPAFIDGVSVPLAHAKAHAAELGRDVG